MKSWSWVVVVMGLAVVFSVHVADEPKKPSGLFSTLKVGQTVTLKEEGASFSISYFDHETPLAHKVTEIGSDHIVLQNVAGMTETTIPIYAVKSVVKVRTKAK